ncbi:MAG: GDSL-like Lipase/Acylhydrolase [Candidatus Izimaplasma bacterium HR2]|nr:MAG: GDSL-like Lipase/Acylhydrolase [Candidatus Izimaplasma bacterium HR2]
MTSKKTIISRYKERLQAIADRDYDKNQVVLIGDCLIENLDIDKHFNEMCIYNNGISGDTTELLIKTLYKRAIKYKPSKLFISIGSNDMGFENTSVKDIYRNIITIVEEVQRRSKDTQIHIVSVIPVNPANMDIINREYVDARDNHEIGMLNYYLKNYVRKNKLKFVDITKHLQNDFEQLDLNYTVDGFHLNEDGYSVVSEQIKIYI